MDFMKKKSAAEIKSAFSKLVTRPGAEKLLAWLEEETDFFTAPASTKHHLNHPGGLMEHSLNVMGNLNRITRRDLNLEDEHSELPQQIAETVVILGLLHDVCKVNCYHLETKRRKNQETGRWEDYQGFVFRDPLPPGTWREKPVPDPAPHGPAAGGGPGDPVAHGRL